MWRHATTPDGRSPGRRDDRSSRGLRRGPGDHCSRSRDNDNDNDNDNDKSDDRYYVTRHHGTPHDDN